MKRRNLVIVTILSLSIAMLTACDGSEESKETTTKQKVELVSSITVDDNDATEEETTITESTTIVADKETTSGEETTAKVDETSKQETTQKETTTKKQEITATQRETTAKKQEITTTQKETTTKKQEITTTQQETTTTKEEETTTEYTEPDDGLKDTLVAAALKVVDSYKEYLSVPAVAFCDYTLDGTPEFFILDVDAYGNTSGQIYKYENGEYKYYMDVYSFGSGMRIYKDKNGNPIVLEFKYTYFQDEDTGEYLSSNKLYLVNINLKTREIFDTVIGDDITNIYKRSYYIDGKTLTADEYFEKISLVLESKYTYIGEVNDLNGISYWQFNENGLKSAYVSYLNNR